MIPNSVFRLLVLCGAMAIQVFGMVSCACSSQPKGDDNNTTSANVASMTIELSDSLLRVGPTSDTIDLGRMYAGVGTADPWSDASSVAAAARANGTPLCLYENANHSLETGDVLHDLATLQDVMQKTQTFIADTPR